MTASTAIIKSLRLRKERPYSYVMDTDTTHQYGATWSVSDPWFPSSGGPLPAFPNPHPDFAFPYPACRLAPTAWWNDVLDRREAKQGWTNRDKAKGT